MRKKEPKEESLSNLLRGNTGILVLSILKDAPAYGYLISCEIERRSQGVLKFKQATLYSLLHELESLGHIQSEWQIVENERPRRVYAITQSGRTYFEKQFAKFQEFSLAVFRVAGVSPNEAP